VDSNDPSPSFKLQQDADEGFASSSSVDEDTLFQLIRRKRHQQQFIVDTSRKLLEEKIKMAPLESILWIISFFWVFFQVFKTTALTFDRQIIAGTVKRTR
jgi:hypothetical protein